MIITTDADRIKVKEYMKQAVDTMRRIKDEQAALRDILVVLKDMHEINPSTARKVINAMEKGNMPEIKEANENLADLYEIVAH